MIDIAAIPVINGDPEMVDEHATSLATTGAAFADTGARIHAQAAADPEDTARLVEINADGQVTFEEFQRLSDVQDAVHAYGGEVLTRLQAEAAFNGTSAAQESAGAEEGE